MIAILDSFINVLTLQMGFILGDMIHILHTIPGAIMATALLVLLEYITIKKIIRDPSSVVFRMIIHSVINITVLALTIIFKNKPIGIIKAPHLIIVPLIDMGSDSSLINKK